jgi:hypothetical protein
VDKQLTDKELIETAKGLYTAIYCFECYSTHDLLEYEWTMQELERRGYEVYEHSGLTILEKEEEVE